MLFALAAKGQRQLTAAPYKQVGSYFGYDFKVGPNAVRAQSRMHIGFIGMATVTKRVLLEVGIGYCKFQRRLFKVDSVYYPAPGYYDYTYRLHAAEALFNVKLNMLIATRYNDEIKLYPVFGTGVGYAFSESKKSTPKNPEYRPTNNFGQYFYYSFKAGLELEMGYQEKVSSSLAIFYQYNRYANNTILDGDNHNIQLQYRINLNFEKKPKKIPLE
jgi:hypothetical protein